MSARWYKRCGADFIHGTMMLTLEEKGAYSLCLDLIYDRGGPIPDDARWLSGVCGVSLRKWAALRERLLSLGKLTTDGEYLSNDRAAFELVSAEKFTRNQAEAGAKGGRKRAENAGQSQKTNDLGQATLKPIEKIREDKKEDTSSDVSSARSPNATVALDIWNSAAVSIGWPCVAKFTASRQASLRSRLKDDGMDGWTSAIAKARASPFLTDPPPPWFTFDFIVKTANFAKLIEGNYDHGQQSNFRSSSRAEPSPSLNLVLSTQADADREDEESYRDAWPQVRAIGNI
jgi:uncharacterized protein YdaU (DUF1376 family)